MVNDYEGINGNNRSIRLNDIRSDSNEPTHRCNI